MHRLIVVLLAAVDAAVAAAVGLAATLAPLTLVWVLALGGSADWGALWPAGATVWQFGNLVPLTVTLPGDYLAVAGIDPTAASFVLSLAPLAFASFTAIFAARSGVRASRAEAWLTGVVTGSLVFAALTALVALTSATPIAAVERWQAILFPALVFAVPLLLGALVTEWREAGSGAVARVRDRIEAAPYGWGEAPGLIVRGAAVVLAGLIGLGALMLAIALIVRGGEVIALFEAAHVDVLGASVVTLAQLAYLPTLAIWGAAFVAGPGFAVGTGTAVSPAATQLGVTPGIPILGALPESTTPWLLLIALLPVGLGALAGWIARSRLVTPVAAESARIPHARADGAPPPEPALDSARSAALAALLSDDTSTPGRADEEDADLEQPTEEPEPIGARAVIALGVAVLSASGAALLCAVASGSMGPGRLSDVGPEPGPVALAVGVEVLIGAAILLLSPRPKVPGFRRRARVVAPASEADKERTEPLPGGAPDAAEREDSRAETEPAPVAEVAASARPFSSSAEGTPPADLGRRRPTPLPPVD